MGRWIATTPSTPVSNEPLEMRMVELEPPPAPSATPATHRPILTPPRTSAAQPRPHTSPEKQPAQTTSLKAGTQPQKDPAPIAPTAKPANSARPQSESPSDENSPPMQPTASPVNSAARSIAHPLPALPDDLREQAYQTVATARFMIHTDGSVDVELIKPTPSPRLNQILLEALHQWRFFPALQNGRPIESQQDVRVHFNVD